MFTYISVEEFADVVVKNNKDANRRELIASLREALAAKRNGARCMICGAPIWAAGSAITGTNMCFTCGVSENSLIHISSPEAYSAGHGALPPASPPAWAVRRGLLETRSPAAPRRS